MDRYGKKREDYYNRNDWEMDVWEGMGQKKVMEMELISRERATQRQEKENRILKAKYNERYKNINVHSRGPKYLWEENLELGRREEVKALLKLRCGNLDLANKYWLDENLLVMSYWSTERPTNKCGARAPLVVHLYD